MSCIFLVMALAISFACSTSSLLFTFIFCSTLCFALVSFFILEFIFPSLILLVCFARVLVWLMKDASFSWGFRLNDSRVFLPISVTVSRKFLSSRMDLGIAHLPRPIWGVFRSYTLIETSWWSVGT